MVQERRQFARIAPREPLIISIGESKPGLLLDLSQGGVAVASLEPRTIDEVISLTFELPEGNGHVRAEGEVAWTRDSGHLTGVRFLELADASRQGLEAWLSAPYDKTAAVATDEPDHHGIEVTEPPEKLLETKTDEDDQATGLPTADLTHSAAEADENKSGVELREVLSLDSSPSHSIKIFLAIILLSWALVFLGYRMGSTRNTEMNPPFKSATATVDASEAKLTTSAKPSDRPLSSQPSLHAVPVSDPGLVLQVGAMKKEANADALASALQKKNFPAFVYQHGPGQLYRVAVGPYSAAENTVALKVKEDLQKQGFKSIVKHWLPE